MDAVVFLADGFEEVEAVSVIDYLRRASVCVKTVAVPSSTMKSEKIAVSARGISVISDLTFGEFEKEYDDVLPELVYVPGGMPGASNIADCEKAVSFLSRCFSAGKIVAAICAAPAVVLSKTGIICGKKWTCYPGMEGRAEEYEIAGSEHVSDVPFVTDGNLVTGRGPGCAEQFSMELVRLMCGEEAARKIKAASIQR